MRMTSLEDTTEDSDSLTIESSHRDKVYDDTSR